MISLSESKRNDGCQAILTKCSDPFIKMAEANKTYGFTIAVKELRETVPNIFRYASAYKRKNNLPSKGLWEMFLEPPPEPEENPQVQDQGDSKPSLPEEILQSEPGHQAIPDVDMEAMEGEKYNMCHFWSNFEIARLDWFRSKEYEDFFQMMDRSGGFWMERVSNQISPYVGNSANDPHSGATPQFILWPLALCCPQRTFTTSEISDIVTLPSSTVLPMRQLANLRENRTWK